MSAEVAVKKRGRPKKVVLDSVEVEVPETKKTPSRAKSTKAAPSVKSKTAVPVRAPAAVKSIPKPIETAATASKASAKPPTTPPPSASQKVETSNFRPAVQSPVTPESSKILSKVRELSAKSTPSPSQSSGTTRASSAASIPKPTNPSRPAAAQTTPPPNPSKPIQSKPAGAPSPPSSSYPQKSASSPASSNAPPKSNPKIPIAALNSAVVSKLSERGGARPNNPRTQQLPPNYKKTLNKVTATIVALPIAIVTSWVLYQRLVLGEEQKFLPRLSPATDDSPPSPPPSTELSADSKE